MSSLAGIREVLASVAQGTSDARGLVAAADAKLEQAERLFADLDGATHESLPTDRVAAARDDLGVTLDRLDRAAQLVDDLDRRL